MTKLPLRAVLILFGILAVLYLVIRAVFTPIPKQEIQVDHSIQEKIPKSLDPLNNYIPGDQFILNNGATPSAVVKKDLEKIYEFTSSMPAIPHVVIVDSENTIIYVEEQIGYNLEENLYDYLDVLHEDPLVLFSEEFSSYHKAYIYPQTGVGFIAQSDNGLIKQKFFFIKTTKSGFLKEYKDNFSEEPHIR